MASTLQYFIAVLFVIYRFEITTIWLINSKFSLFLGVMGDSTIHVSGTNTHPAH